MNAYILNDQYQLVQVIDLFESFIWTDRLNEVGEFEIQAVATINLLSYLKKGAYVQIQESDKLMIIETITYVSDVENGDHITVSGRSLESILDRRVILKEITLDGPLEEGIMRILNENVIDPEDKDRTFPIVTFKKSENEAITRLTAKKTYHGESVLSAVVELCQLNNIGFRVLPDFENSGFIFELYAGIDRSYEQNENPPVVFSPEYENIINSSYVNSDASLKNLVYVENDSDNFKIEVYSGLKFDFELEEGEESATPPAGRDRRESYISSSVSVPEESPYGPPESYVERVNHGHWETYTDWTAYHNQQEENRQRARDLIARAGGTEADIDWPPPGREGQAYEDYVADIPVYPYQKSVYVHDYTWTPAMLSAEERADWYFKKALSDPETYAKYEMREEGLAELLDNRTVKTFDGDIVNYFQFIAERDYHLGDVVQMVNGLFINVPTRFTEITYYHDSSGIRAVPTFTTDLDIDAKEGI